MADTTLTLYDALGNPVTIGATEARPVQATTAPGNGHTVRDTTRQLQQAAEYVAPAQVVDGQTHLPFGPPLSVDVDTDGAEIPPGFPTVVDEQGLTRRSFRLAASVGMMPMLRFAHAAKAGMDSEDMEGMAALYTMIQDCVEPADWSAFVEYATTCKADDEALMEFVQRAMEIITARKEKRRGNSSATSPNTSAKSKASSSGQATPIPAGTNTPDGVEGLMPVSELTR